MHVIEDYLFNYSIKTLILKFMKKLFFITSCMMLFVSVNANTIKEISDPEVTLYKCEITEYFADGRTCTRTAFSKKTSSAACDQAQKEPCNEIGNAAN